MEAQLTARCASLLEAYGNDSHKGSKRIQYLHRIARDSMESPKKWQKLIAHATGTDFIPNTFVAQVLYTQANSSSPTAMPAKLDGVGEIFVEEQDIACSAVIFAYFVEIQTHKPYTALLDELDKTYDSTQNHPRCSSQMFIGVIVAQHIALAKQKTSSHHSYTLPRNSVYSNTCPRK
jgi:hypothetical protein